MHIQGGNTLSATPVLRAEGCPNQHLDSGVPVGDLQDQLGHASLATTSVYLKVSPNHRRTAYMRSKLPSFLAGEKLKKIGHQYTYTRYEKLRSIITR